jgi:hypothetical protein
MDWRSTEGGSHDEINHGPELQASGKVKGKSGGAIERV